MPSSENACPIKLYRHLCVCGDVSETGSLSTIPNFIRELLLFSLSALRFTIRRRKVQPRSTPISALRHHDKKKLRKAQEGLQEWWRQRRDPPRHRPWPALPAGAEKRGAARRSPFSLFRRFFSLDCRRSSCRSPASCRASGRSRHSRRRYCRRSG